MGKKNIIKNLKKKYAKAELLKKIPNINVSNKYVFIHIPKNAGTSIYEALGMTRSLHHYYTDYERILGRKEIGEYFRFSFVRNPWARFVSLYDYARMPVSYHHNALDPQNAKYGKHQDYDLLKEATLEQCAEYLIDGKLTHGHPYTQWDNQNKWLKNESGHIKLSFLGRMENIDKDCRMLGYFLQKDIQIMHLNSANQGNYRDRLSTQCASIIGRYYEEDIDIFKYNY